MIFAGATRIRFNNDLDPLVEVRRQDAGGTVPARKAKSDPFVRDANKSLQANLDRGEPVIFASYAIVGAILLFGGTGYALDRWLDTLPWFFFAGVAIGLCIAFCALLNAVRERGTDFQSLMNRSTAAFNRRRVCCRNLNLGVSESPLDFRPVTLCRCDGRASA
jgi:F0F1-type ATP synthase assembly protein I